MFRAVVKILKHYLSSSALLIILVALANTCENTRYLARSLLTGGVNELVVVSHLS